MSAVSLGGRGDPVVVARGAGAIHGAEDGDERGGKGVVSLDELDLDSGRVGGDDLSRGAGGAPGEGVVPASHEDSAEITLVRDGVVEVGVVGDDGLDSGSEGQSGSDDSLGEHYGYMCVKGRKGWLVVRWKRWRKRREKKKKKREEKESGDQGIFKGNLTERKRLVLGRWMDGDLLQTTTIAQGAQGRTSV